MITRIFIASILIALNVAGIAKAQSSAQPDTLLPDTLLPDTLLPDTLLPEIIRAPNGATAWLIEDNSLPIITFHAVFQGAGSASDPLGKRGLAYFHNGMLGETSNGQPGFALRQQQEDLSIAIDSNIGRDSFSFGIRTLTRHLDTAKNLINTIMHQPDFDPQDIARVRKQLLANLARRATRPGQVAGDRLWQELYPNHPYAHPPIGIAQDIMTITREDLQNYHDTQLSRNRLIITFVGNIDADTARAWLQDLSAPLAQNAPSSNIRAIAPLAPLAITGEVINVPLDVVQDQLAFAHQGPLRTDDDFYGAAIINQMLGGNILSSFLGQEIREKRGLAYSVSTNLHPLQHSALWLGWGATRNRSEFIAATRTVWQNIANGHFTKDQFENARNNLLDAFDLGLNDRRSVARLFTRVQQLNLPRDYIEWRVGKFMDVDYDRAKIIAQKWLNSKKLTFIIVGQALDTLNSDTEE